MVIHAKFERMGSHPSAQRQRFHRLCRREDWSLGITVVEESAVVIFIFLSSDRINAFLRTVSKCLPRYKASQREENAVFQLRLFCLTSVSRCFPFCSVSGTMPNFAHLRRICPSVRKTLEGFFMRCS